MRAIAGLIFCLSGVLSASATIDFATPVKYPVGQGPTGIAVGDLNGDGKLDVAVTNQADENVVVLFGRGDGTFGAAVPHSLGNLGTSWPIGVAVGDFNGDGKQDLAVITALNGSDGGIVLVLLGKGDGTFQSPVTSATNISPVTIATADFNRDGKLDLLLGGSGSAAVLLGNGDGTFQVAPNLPALQNQSSDIGKQWAVGVADLNGDGRTDLFTANWGGFASSASVYLADATGQLQNGTQYVTQNNGSPGGMWITAADVNRDGKPDLLMTSYLSSAMSVFLGNGDGTFQAPVDYDPGITPNQFVVADFDLDGKLDFAASDFNDTNYSPNNPTSFGVTVAAGNGDGTFAQSFYRDPGTNSTGVVAGDFNGDGLLDLVVVHRTTNDISVLINNSAVVRSATSVAVNAPSTLSAGSSLTLVATVHASTETATGSVLFKNGSVSLGSATLVNGTAMLRISNVAAGTYSIVASYAGNAALAGSNSAPSTVTVSQDFAISTATASLNVSAGNSATTNVTISPELGGFSTAIQLACSGAPTLSTCSLTPTSVGPNTASATVVLKVQTTAPTATQLRGTLSRLYVALLLPMLTIGLRADRRKLGKAVLVVVALMCVLAIASCGGGSTSTQTPPASQLGTPAGTYNLTVTATGGSTSHSIAMKLVVN